MRIVDRLLAIVLLLGVIGHTLGSIKAYAAQPMTLLWALCASALLALVGVINLVRASRPADRSLAWIAAAGAALWLIAALAFGCLIRNFLDPRVITFVIACVGLIAFSMRTAVRRTG